MIKKYFEDFFSFLHFFVGYYTYCHFHIYLFHFSHHHIFNFSIFWRIFSFSHIFVGYNTYYHFHINFFHFSHHLIFYFSLFWKILFPFYIFLLHSFCIFFYNFIQLVLSLFSVYKFTWGGGLGCPLKPLSWGGGGVDEFRFVLGESPSWGEQTFSLIFLCSIIFFCFVVWYSLHIAKHLIQFWKLLWLSSLCLFCLIVKNVNLH